VLPRKMKCGQLVEKEANFSLKVKKKKQ
jgi:hypothetical protein